MRFSDAFDVIPTHSDDWFDLFLSVDTRLFLDPFLLYATEEGVFAGSHAEVISFFNCVFRIIARSRGRSSSNLWNLALGLLRFPEVDALCLGYTRAGTRGSGSGRGLAQLFTEAIWEAIQAGVTHISHFEEICILREGIGADRISDMTASLIRRRLARYTESICGPHCVPGRDVRWTRGIFDANLERWMPLTTHLPTNPYTDRPILLVPRKYLRELPTINAEDFWEYCYSNENETLRHELSHDITRRVSKGTIVAFARDHPAIRQRYIAVREDSSAQPYDFSADTSGLVQWYQAARDYCHNNPLALQIRTDSDLRDAISSIISEFRHYVEDNRGWNLLWNDDQTPRKESAAQDLFLGIAKHYCVANDIDISREADMGRGSVDFKTSRGFRCRALIEVKLARNTKFWNGLDRQLPKYQDAEQVLTGFFLVIAFSSKDLKKVNGIRERVEDVNRRTGYEIKSIVVNAQRAPPSASNL